MWDRWAGLRVRLAYLTRHGRLPRLRDPTLFTEHVQCRKLGERDARLPILIDKITVKSFAGKRLGQDWITPTLWSGDVLPAAPLWPHPFVVKSRHGCNQSRFIRSEFDDWDAVRRASARWMRRDYGRWLDEDGYRGIPRGLLVEPFVGDGLDLPTDYKLYVFHGRVEFVQVHLDREGDHRWLLFNRTWRRVSSPTADPDPIPPVSLKRMVQGAEALARDIDFVRVDLYEIEGRPRFGEMTFYPGSGLDPFDPPELDAILGALWRGRQGEPPPAGGQADRR